MSLYDFATVQVYKLPDYVEVVFPYDADFVSYLKSIKGRWNPNRKCWTVKADLAKKSVDEIIAEIENQLYDIGPETWKQVSQKIKNICCVMKNYEIYAGAGGLRIELPPGHPSHYKLKEIKGILQNKTKWSIPSKLVNHKEVKSVIQRILKEDKNKFFDWMEPSEDRYLTGYLNIHPEEESVYGIIKDQMIRTTRNFIKVADPGFFEAPISEFAFTLVKHSRETENKISVKLEYPDVDEAYKYLSIKNNKPKIIDSDITEDKWTQRRY